MATAWRSARRAGLMDRTMRVSAPSGGRIAGRRTRAPLLGATPGAEGTNFRVVECARRGSGAVPLTRTGRNAGSSWNAARAAYGPGMWPASARAPATVTGCTGRTVLSTGTGSIPPSCCSTPTPAASRARSRSARSISGSSGRRRSPWVAPRRPRLRPVHAEGNRRARDAGHRRRGTPGHPDGPTRSSTRSTSRASRASISDVPEPLRGTYAGLAAPGRGRATCATSGDGGRAPAGAPGASQSPRSPLQQGLPRLLGLQLDRLPRPRSALRGHGRSRVLSCARRS